MEDAETDKSEVGETNASKARKNICGGRHKKTPTRVNYDEGPIETAITRKERLFGCAKNKKLPHPRLAHGNLMLGSYKQRVAIIDIIEKDEAVKPNKQRSTVMAYRGSRDVLFHSSDSAKSYLVEAGSHEGLAKTKTQQPKPELQKHQPITPETDTVRPSKSAVI